MVNRGTYPSHATGQGFESPMLVKRRRLGREMGVAARPVADLTAPLALGVAEVPARRSPRLSGRGSPRGFVEGYALSGRASACAQQPLMPCGHPVNRGAYPPPATGRGEKPRNCSIKKAPNRVPFCMELTSHQLGKVLTGNRVFCFYYVHPKQMMKRL